MNGLTVTIRNNTLVMTGVTVEPFTQLRRVTILEAFGTKGDDARYFRGGIRASFLERHFLPEDDSKPIRTWRQIAEEASQEEDPEKLLKLARELERALDERRRKLYPASNREK